MQYLPPPFTVPLFGIAVVINTLYLSLTNVFNVRQATVEDIIKSAQFLTQTVNNGFQGAWVELASGSSHIYLVIVQIALAFATVFTAFWSVSFFNTLSHEGFTQRTIEQLAPTLIIVLMLGLGQGAIPAGISQALHNAIERTDNLILTQTINGIEIGQGIQAANSNQALQQVLTGKVQACQLLPNSDKDNGQDSQSECIREAVKDVTKVAQETKNNNGSGDWFKIDLDLKQIAVQPFNEVILAVLEILLSAFQMGFVFLIQICAILNAYTAPLFLALSLLPGQVKLIHAWLSGWLALGLVKISYTIIVGLATSVIVNTEQGNVLLLPILQGLLSPILALGIASGGGLALFNGLAGVAGGGVRFLIRSGQPSYRNTAPRNTTPRG